MKIRSIRAGMVGAVVAVGLMFGSTVATASTPAVATAATVHPMASTLAADTAYVDGVYLALLNRHAGSTPYPAKLANGSLTPKTFVTLISNSQERRLNIVNSLFQDCLGRGAGTSNTWVTALKTDSLYSVAAAICGSTEAYLHSGRNYNKLAATLVAFSGFGPKTAAVQEVSRGILRNGLKKEAEIVFLAPVTSGFQLDILYEKFFGRSVDKSGLHTFEASMPYRGFFTVPVALGTSKEFISKF